MSLKGRGNDNKCLRETEFANLGVPIALNYKPFFSFPFQNGKEYIYLNAPQEILNLENIDNRPFAQKSKELGELYFSPEGCIRLVKELLNQETYNLEF